MQAAEAHELPKLLAGALEPVGGERVQLLPAQAHLSFGLLAEREQPLFGSKQRQAPRLALVVQSRLPVVQLASSCLQALMVVRQLWLCDRRVGVQRVCEGLRDLPLA